MHVCLVINSSRHVKLTGSHFTLGFRSSTMNIVHRIQRRMPSRAYYDTRHCARETHVLGEQWGYLHNNASHHHPVGTYVGKCLPASQSTLFYQTLLDYQLYYCVIKSKIKMADWSKLTCWLLIIIRTNTQILLINHLNIYNTSTTAFRNFLL